MKKQLNTGIIIFISICISLLAALLCNTLSATGKESYTKEELINSIEQIKTVKATAHEMANNARFLGWTDEDKIVKEIKEKWREADNEQTKYQELLDKIIAKEIEEQQKIEEEKRKAEEERLAKQAAEEAKWAQKSAEYPAATKIWRYMKALGWNDYVCAGIMGNLMTEVGGQTLDIRYSLSSNGYYGMCQWNRAYSQIWGAGLDSQCDFLRDTIKYEFDTYGFKYQKGFNFNSFLNMTDAKQAALAFAKSYERCGSGSYEIRQNNAIKAYSYFVN